MPFHLEALAAKHGDALLLHYGTDDAPRLIVIDGGPATVYRNALRPRLNELREAYRSRTGLDESAPLPVRLLMVSHIDDDHVHGVLDLVNDLVDEQDDGRPLSCDVETLWHNAFDDLLGNGAEALSASVAGAASAGTGVATGAPISRHGGAVAASVGQGRRLRDAAAVLGLAVNAPDGGLVTAPATGRHDVSMGDGLTLTVLGPNRQRVVELQEEWDRQIQKSGAGQPAPALAAAYVDKSVFNLASVVVLAEQGGRTMLLTGDARGDDVLGGLLTAGLLGDEGTVHVDLLKVPHHGSDHNVATDFFRRVTADHYVFSGDGEHGNPEPATLRMLLEARGDASYTFHFTYETPSVAAFFEHVPQPHSFDVRYRDAAAHSVDVDLGG